jgi:hypothetical protein
MFRQLYGVVRLGFGCRLLVEALEAVRALHVRGLTVVGSRPRGSGLLQRPEARSQFRLRRRQLPLQIRQLTLQIRFLRRQRLRALLQCKIFLQTPPPNLISVLSSASSETSRLGDVLCGRSGVSTRRPESVKSRRGGREESTNFKTPPSPSGDAPRCRPSRACLDAAAAAAGASRAAVARVPHTRRPLKPSASPSTHATPCVRERELPVDWLVVGRSVVGLLQGTG